MYYCNYKKGKNNTITLWAKILPKFCPTIFLNVQLTFTFITPMNVNPSGLPRTRLIGHLQFYWDVSLNGGFIKEIS